MNAHREHCREFSIADDVRFIFSVLRRKSWVIAASTLACMMLGVMYIYISPRIYEAKAVIQIEQEAQSVMRIEGGKPEDLKAVEVLKTFEQSLTSPEVLLRILRNYHLAKRHDFLPEVKRPASENALLEAFSKHIKAELRRGTRLIDITVEDTNPALAKQIADMLLLEFAQWNFEAQREAGKLASNSLIEKVDRLKARLAISEQMLYDYKEKNDAVSLEEKQNIIVEKLRELNLRVTVAKADRIKLEADVVQMRQTERRSVKGLLLVPAVANSPDVVELKKSLAAKEAFLAQLGQRYGVRHHKFAEAQMELEKLRMELSASAIKAAEVLETTCQAAALNEQKLEAALREQEKLALDLNRIGIPYAALTRDVEADRAMYKAVLASLKEADVTKDIAPNAVRVIAHPLQPDRPSKPQKKLVLTLSMLAGLAIGGAVAFGSHAVDRSLASWRDAEALLGLRPLAEIPRSAIAKRGAAGSSLLPTLDPIVAESFRSLTASLSFFGESAPKSVLFTSAHHGDGKTFCAAGCAASFAELGMRTLLVDADYRTSAVRRLFFGDTRLGTVADLSYLSGSEDKWEDVAQLTSIPNLSILSTVKGAADSANLLDAERVKQLIQWAASKYDRIIVDGAPAELGSDTLLVARHVQAVCLVIQAGQTPAEDVTQAAHRLAEAGAPVVGFVWNQAKEAASPSRKRTAENVDASRQKSASQRSQENTKEAEPQMISPGPSVGGPSRTERIS